MTERFRIDCIESGTESLNGLMRRICRRVKHSKGVPYEEENPYTSLSCRTSRTRRPALSRKPCQTHQRFSGLQGNCAKDWLLTTSKNGYISDMKTETIQGRMGIDFGALFSDDLKRRNECQRSQSTTSNIILKT